MNVKTITFAGDTGLTATIMRERPANGPECIFCEIVDTNGDRIAIHHVATDDRDDQFSMAECLQNQLDGYRGTNSEIHDYFRMIQILAD